MSYLEEMIATGMVKFFVCCEACSKQKECGMRFSPGCCNWAGFRETLKEKTNNKGEDNGD